MKKYLTGIVTSTAFLAHAQVDRAGNVMDEEGGGAAIGGGVVLAVVGSLVVMKIWGEAAMFKIWGAFLAIALVVGVAKNL